jgi:hypothetical protein
MKARIIVQINEDTGQKNVIFTLDMMAPLEDFLVGSWPNSKVLTGTVLLLTLDGDILIERMLDTELHSVLGSDTGEEFILSPEVEAQCRALLEGVLNGNTNSGQ